VQAAQFLAVYGRQVCVGILGSNFLGGQSSIYGFPCIRIYFIKGGGYHCTGVRVADEPCRPAVQAKRKTERKKPPEAKVGLESS
jgi:hypothetical protein